MHKYSVCLRRNFGEVEGKWSSQMSQCHTCHRGWGSVIDVISCDRDVRDKSDKRDLSDGSDLSLEPFARTFLLIVTSLMSL